MTIQLIPMNEEHFVRFLDSSIKDYAEEHVKAGNWTEEEALTKSQEEFSTLLPNGLATKNHLLFSIQNNGQTIGVLWLHIRNKSTEKHAFIYNIELDEQERGKGYGKATMKALDDFAQRERIKKISLHVFAHNPHAISLYEKSGYAMVDCIMAKCL